MKIIIGGAVAAALALSVLSSASASPEPRHAPVTLSPGSLERGPEVQTPHLVGRTLVHGQVRINLGARGTFANILGQSDRAYVVVTQTRDGRRQSVLRYHRNGSFRVLVRASWWSTFDLSSDGDTLIQSVQKNGRRTTIRAHDAQTGQRLRSRVFQGSVHPLDARGARVLLGSWGPDRTLWWNTSTGATETITNRTGYAASIRGNTLASFTKDPYEGGCTLLTQLTDPSQRLWRSCGERVDAMAPNGRRLSTIHILSDGPGARNVTVRGPRGGMVARYRTGGWFGSTEWESNRSLLVLVIGRNQTTTARCVVRTCKRASRLTPTRLF